VVPVWGCGQRASQLNVGNGAAEGRRLARIRGIESQTLSCVQALMINVIVSLFQK
jgi:hypothetical protein